MGSGGIVSHSSHEQIELRAYGLWENRGRPLGTPEVDWFRAERELTEESKHHALGDIAREVGGLLGTAVAFVSGKPLHDNSRAE
jgi:hypothetical protein